MDVDVDLSPAWKGWELFPEWVRASMVQNEKLLPHNVGMYPQRMVKDPVTGLAAIPYEEAEELGYLKVDFLPLHVYKHFKSRAEIEELVAKEPDWNLLLAKSNQEKLFQLSKHGELLDKLKPRSIQDLADAMALIRPGKKNLLGLYLKDKESARKVLFVNDDSGYVFKGAHAAAYALVVILQLHLIEQARL